MRDTGEASWWRKTRLLALTAVVVLALFCLLPVAIPGFFSAGTFFGLPFPVFMVAIVAPLFIAGGIFSFAARQQALDRRHDVAEE
jgi:putative solute:sodium symporter small subunit